MCVQLSCIVVDPNSADAQELASFLTEHGVEVAAQVGSVEHLPGLLGRPDGPQLAMVNLGAAPQALLAKVGHLVRQFPAVSFFVLSQQVDASLLMEAMHQGVREFVPLPVDKEKLAAGLERASQLHGMSRRGRVVNFIPSTGGCGSTTIACNVAVALARSGKAALLDMDLVRGSVATAFDLRPRYTIADLIGSADKIDRQLLESALTVHQASGLAVLARPEAPEDANRIRPQPLSRLLDVVGRVYDYVVVDSLMGMDPLNEAVIQAADLNVVVMQLNVPSTRNTERLLSALRRKNVPGSKIRLVVNRLVKKGRDIEPDEVERALKMKIDWMVPNDFKASIDAINFGQPVVLRSPRAEIATSLCQLAQSLNGVHKP